MLRTTKQLLLGVAISVIATLQPVSADPFKGQSIYNKYCTGCHGGNGAGALAGTPSFRAGSTVLMKPDSELVKIIRLGNGVMPGFNSRLKDDQIYDVISYIRTFF